MIGIGCDIEEIEPWQREAAARVFTQRELEQNRTDAGLTARWCGKEAIIKAMTMKIRNHKITYEDIEILDDDAGAPVVNIRGLTGYTVEVTLSHCDSHAMAVAIIEEV
jgi:phosphopantetheine--protein transferase-like protein